MTEPDFTTISAAIRVGDWPQVENLTRASLAQHPHREELLFMLAVSLQMQERTDETLEAYERLIDLHPDNANYWGNYATELRKAGAARRGQPGACERFALEAGRRARTGQLWLAAA